MIKLETTKSSTRQKYPLLKIGPSGVLYFCIDSLNRVNVKSGALHKNLDMEYSSSDNWELYLGAISNK